MGTDLWTLIEVSNNGEPWRVLGTMNRAMKTRRDYPLFSILADVANHGGRHEPTWQEPRTVTLPDGETAEVPGWWYSPDDGGHDRIEPISLPRGVPDDATDDWKATVLMWKVKSKSVDTSWLTPEEIVAGPWDQPLTFYGMVSEDEYAALKKDGTPPDNHVNQVGGPHVRVVSEEEYEAGERGEEITYINARWSAGTVREQSGYMLAAMEEVLMGLPSTYKVRIMLLFEA